VGLGSSFQSDLGAPSGAFVWSCEQYIQHPANATLDALTAISNPTSAQPRTSLSIAVYGHAGHFGRLEFLPERSLVLYACLATTIWLVNRRVGTFALLYAVIFVGFPSVYAGYHYPTDILAGTAVGIGCAMLARVGRLRNAVAEPALRWFQDRPAVLQAFMFICTFEIAESFTSSYEVLLYLVKACKSF
jgi:PAP2 superfamily